MLDFLLYHIKYIIIMTDLKGHPLKIYENMILMNF